MVYFIEVEWKTVKNFKNVIDDVYEISNCGDIRIKGSSEKVTTKIAKKYTFSKKKLYTQHQLYTISLLPKILELEKEGKTDREIFDAIWDINKVSRKSKMLTLSQIRRRIIYKDVISELEDTMFND